MRTLSALFIATLIAFSFTSSLFADEKPAQKYETLFIVGGADFHDPVELPPILEKELEGTGKFDVTVTEDISQLGPENIDKYDIIINYTTGHTLGKDREEALWDFVNGGKPYIGIHSATDSFKDSDKYWKLTAGRFVGHGGGKFQVDIIDKEHPITKGMESFEIEDETYKHAFHPESNRHVLMRRPMDNEDVSWVQTIGDGRVFVTGLGHGKPAWENPAFKKMVVRACLWGVKEL